MDTITKGLAESVNGLAGKHKSPSEITISTVSVDDHSDSEKTASATDELMSSTSTMVAHNQSHSTIATVQRTRILETSKEIRTRIYKLGDYSEAFFRNVDLESYLEYISDERLIHMPRRGSDWDRVLRSAQFFGLQLYRLGSNVRHFCPGAEAASVTALGATQVLLEIGPHQAQALVFTFQVLYDLGRLVSHVVQIHEVFSSSTEVKEDVAHLYCGLVDLVGRIAILYREKISSLGSNKSGVVNFEANFGKAVATIWATRDSIVGKMWSLQLHRHQAAGLSLAVIRRRLQNDRSAKGIFYDQVSESVNRAEDTCEWLGNHLTEFFRGKDKALTITGDSGSGKTVLAGWIKERLQRPLNHKQFSTLTYSFPFDHPARCTVLAFLKSILFQLLERNVGDVDLYNKLTAALESYGQHHNTAKFETSLWAALEAGLRSIDTHRENLAIIVDGFEQVSGGVSPLDFHRKLRDIVAKFKTIRIITLSKAISHLSEGCTHFTITAQHLHGDLAAYFRQSFSRFTSFSQLSSERREKLIHDLTHKAKASFLWAYAVVRLLTKEAPSMPPDSFAKAAEGISGTLEDQLKKLVSRLSLKHDTTQTLLSFLLATERPLGLYELAELLKINIQNRAFGSKVDVKGTISSTCGDVVVIENGTVHFKSKSVRSYMQSLMGKSLPSVRDAQRSLTLALLLYSKLALQGFSEPSFEVLADGSVEEHFSSHGLLRYAVKHWQSHFRASSFYADGKLTLGKDFIEFFPDSCHFSLLERWALIHGVPAREHAKHHEFSLKVQEACFGENHVTVVQSLIILGNIHVSFASDTLLGAKFFYRAASLGQLVLSMQSPVVVTCTHYFLDLTRTITIVERTEIVTYREVMILLMIEICKGRHGAESDHVIKWYKVLAQLYVDIKETHKATVIYQKLRAIIIIRFGKGSSEYRGICEHLGELDVMLSGEVNEKEIREYGDLIIETADDVDEERRVSVLLKLALFYMSQKRWFLAEKIYVTLWRRLSELCRIQHTIELHITKIEIAIAYIKFLKTCGRVEEASSILICLWVEYEHHSFEERTIVVLIKELGVLFKSFGLLQIAISVFTKVWGWFKSKGKIDDKECGHTTILISEVVEEYTETTTETTTTTTTVETVTREVFETHFTRCKGGKADHAFFSACLALVNLYIKLGHWSKAEVVIRQSLEITWKAILTTETTVTLSEHCIKECILLATRLAVCYRSQHLFEKAEAMYLRIFRACLVSLHIEDVLVQEALTVLIHFYEEHHRHEKVLEIYIEVLERYRKHLGHSHRLIIKTLYALAAHCRLLGRAEAYEYYLEIVTILNKGRKHCHHDAFEAAVILVRYYNEKQQWLKLKDICVVLFETFVHCHKEIHFTEEIIQFIYERYLHVLEVHVKVDVSVRYEISVKFRQTVEVVYGTDSLLFLEALIALAAICEHYEGHEHEAVTIYEVVITRTRTTTVETKTKVTTVKKRLSKLYVTIITGGGGSSSPIPIDKAIALCLEVYLELKITLGCWHEKTLLKLKETITLYLRVNTKESHGKIVELLHVAFIEIVTFKCKSMELYHAALALASIYILAGLQQYALKLVHQLRHLVIFGQDFEITVDILVKVDAKLVTRSALVFLVAFQQSLTEKVVMTYSELLAVTLLEISLYEQYKEVIETETNTEIVLDYGAKLRSFWVEQGQEQLLVVLDKRLFHLFKTKYAAFITTHDDYTWLLYLALTRSLGRDLTKIDFPALVCRAGNAEVASLLEAGEFKKALEVARCTFHFAHKQGLYNSLSRVQYAYKLAEFMAGIDVRRPTDPKLWEQYLILSKHITGEALATFRAHDIDFVRLKFQDLAGIVRLLGSQQNYGELESLLLKLWQSREVQKTWDATRVISIGRLMVHAHVAANHIPAAIDLCETMCYNLRRSRGVLDPVTVEMLQMLAELYTSDNRVDRCMSIHEQILREIEAALRDAEEAGPIKLYSSTGTGQKQQPQLCGQPSLQPDVLAKTANWQLELLKRAHHRRGGFARDEHEREFDELYARLKERLGKAGSGVQAPAPSTWGKAAAANKDKPDDMIGKYVGPREKEWRLDAGEVTNGSEGHVHGHGGVKGGNNGAVVVQDKSSRRRSRWTVDVDHILVASREWLVI